MNGARTANDNRSVSRRDFLAMWLGRTSAQPAASAITATETFSGTALARPDRTAIVQGRFCLAHQRSFCSTCVERCPVPGALLRRGGLPMVDPSLCNGCGICHDVCPAPRNAILLLPKRTSDHPPLRSP